MILQFIAVFKPWALPERHEEVRTDPFTIPNSRRSIVWGQLKRVRKLKRIDLHQELFDEMIQYRLLGDALQPEIHVLEQHERPPINQIPEYREKFSAVESGRIADPAVL